MVDEMVKEIRLFAHDNGRSYAGHSRRGIVHRGFEIERNDSTDDFVDEALQLGIAATGAHQPAQFLQFPVEVRAAPVIGQSESQNPALQTSNDFCRSAIGNAVAARWRGIRIGNGAVQVRARHCCSNVWCDVRACVTSHSPEDRRDKSAAHLPVRSRCW